jgi:hypothetical protein
MTNASLSNNISKEGISGIFQPVPSLSEILVPGECVLHQGNKGSNDSDTQSDQ